MKIKSIKPIGEHQCYDLKMAAPHNNYVTNGVVVHNTAGITELAQKLHVEQFADISHLIALFRPGVTRTTVKMCPSCKDTALVWGKEISCSTCGWRTKDAENTLSMAAHLHYIEKKRGRVPVSYRHPLLKEILEPTYGTFIFQESIMRCCNVLAGYPLSETDRIRKMLGKMDGTALRAEREAFVDGCLCNADFVSQCSNPRETADAIFSDFEAAGSYAFNASHSVAYATNALYCAWMKHHYPIEFMTALLRTCKVESIKRNVREARRLGITVLGPDINESGEHFTIVGENTIRFGLHGIKWVGAAANVIQEARPFKSIPDIIQRIPKRVLNKRVMEHLIMSGTLNSLAGNERDALTQYWEARGDWKKGDDWDIYVHEIVGNVAAAEVLSLGQSIAHDPMLTYGRIVQSETNFVSEDAMIPQEVACLSGMIVDVRLTTTKKGAKRGAKMAIIDVEPFVGEETGVVTVVIFPKSFDKFGSKAEEGAPIMVDVSKLDDGGLCANDMVRLDELMERING